jgi:hypothetical protein
MIREALKTLLLVNAFLAVGFGIFIELMKLCLALGFSPWWVAVLFVTVPASWLWRNCHAPVRV